MVKEFAFVNQAYRPTSNDLICLFKVMPEGMSLKEAANNVALESSVGTWTPVSSNQKYVNKLGAKVFAISGNWVKIAYPQELFEEGSVSNILSVSPVSANSTIKKFPCDGVTSNPMRFNSL